MQGPESSLMIYKCQGTPNSVLILWILWKERGSLREIQGGRKVIISIFYTKSTTLATVLGDPNLH